MKKKRVSISLSDFINTEEGQEQYRKWQIKQLEKAGYSKDKRVAEIEKKIKTPKVKEVEEEEELY